MENNIDKQLDVNINKSIEGLVGKIAKLNLSVEEVYELIKTFGEEVRAKIHLVAISYKYKDLAKKIEIVNEKIKKERITNFIDSLVNGTNDEFFANMSFVDKISLKVDIEHSKDLDLLSLEVKKFLEIIENSIYSDLLKMAKDEGFDSVEDWQKNNALKADADPFHIKKTSVGHMRQIHGKQLKFK